MYMLDTSTDLLVVMWGGGTVSMLDTSTDL